MRWILGEKEQESLTRLFDDVSTGDQDDEMDPYEDVDSEYMYDGNYVPSDWIN